MSDLAWLVLAIGAESLWTYVVFIIARTQAVNRIEQEEREEGLKRERDPLYESTRVKAFTRYREE